MPTAHCACVRGTHTMCMLQNQPPNKFRRMNISIIATMQRAMPQSARKQRRTRCRTRSAYFCTPSGSVNFSKRSGALDMLDQLQIRRSRIRDSPGDHRSSCCDALPACTATAQGPLKQADSRKAKSRDLLATIVDKNLVKICIKLSGASHQQVIDCAPCRSFTASNS